MIATHADILKRVRLLIQRLQRRVATAWRTFRNARKARIAPGKLFAQSSGQRSPTPYQPAYACWSLLNEKHKKIRKKPSADAAGVVVD